MARRVRALAALASLVVALAGCGAQAPASGTPESVVHDAITRAANKDVAGLQALACAGQADIVREQLSLSGLEGIAAALPGLDTAAALDAMTIDAGKIKVGTATIEGDVAHVPVTGSVAATFDREKVRPIVRRVLEAQGQTLTDQQLDRLLESLAAFGQDVPLNQSVRLVREGGSWKVCQEAP